MEQPSSQQAKYCGECGRGTWSCTCGKSFAEKLQGFKISSNIKYTETDLTAPRVPKKAPLEDFKGDERYGQLMDLRDRMISVDGHSPFDSKDTLTPNQKKGRK